MSLEGIYMFPFVFLDALPYAYRGIVRRRCEEPTVGRERERPHSGCMSGECLEAVPVLLWVIDVELYCVIVGGGCEDLRWVTG